MFRTELGSTASRAVSPSITAEYIQIGYENTNEEVAVSRDSGRLWIENSDGDTESFFLFYSGMF